MIPAGWALVPLIPSERMLNEFSEVAWPDRKELGPIWQEKRKLELLAYSAMLAAAPTPPVAEALQVEELRRQIWKLEGIIKDKNRGIAKLKAKLKEAE